MVAVHEPPRLEEHPQVRKGNLGDLAALGFGKSGERDGEVRFHEGDDEAEVREGELRFVGGGGGRCLAVGSLLTVAVLLLQLVQLLPNRLVVLDQDAKRRKHLDHVPRVHAHIDQLFEKHTERL